MSAVDRTIASLLDVIERSPCRCEYGPLTHEKGGRGPLIARCERCRTLLEHGR